MSLVNGDIWSAGFASRCGRVSYKDDKDDKDDKDELMDDVIVRPREVPSLDFFGILTVIDQIRLFLLRLYGRVYRNPLAI